MQRTRLKCFAPRNGRATHRLWRLYVGALFAMLYCLAVPAAAPDGASAGAAAAPALPAALDQTAALRASQAVIGHRIGDYALLDREGRTVRLSRYRGKPLLVSFIYTGCFRVCPTTTRSLQKVVLAAQAALGEGKFKVISIGFNQPADSPQALSYFAKQYGINSPDWDFLSPPASIVAQLARDFGFSFAATPAGFDHLLQLSVVGADGRIYRQIYGEDYPPDKLIEPLKQLISGAPVADTATLSSIIERVRLLCSVYDPVTGTYRVSYGLVLDIAGGVTFLLWIIGFFLNEWLMRRRSARRACA